VATTVKGNEAVVVNSDIGSDTGSEQEPDITYTLDTAQDKVSEIKDIIDAVYYEPYDEELLYDDMYKGMMEALGDPYSSYFTPGEFQTLMESSSGSYEGIGVVISFSEDGEDIVVVAPFEGSPGDLAGLRPNDVIRAADGLSLEGMTLEEAVNYIKGDKGTEVTLTIFRPSTEETLDIVVIRDEITQESVYYEMLGDDIGYIRLTGFQDQTDEQFEDALDDLDGQGQKGLIIDLRNNPGGLLTTVNTIADRLLGESLIVYTEDKNGKKKEYFSNASESFDKPIVVLVNDYSASASEILAGALKDLGVGTLVGTTTYGKGLVQNIIPLSDGSALKVTIAKYFTPSGAYINQVGIEPDITVALEDDMPYLFDTEQVDDVQLQKAIETMLGIIQ
jgi:carboxyl-terminal processing protease